MQPYYSENGLTIYHGDCRDVLPSLSLSGVGLVLTDPPYGLERVMQSGGNWWGRSVNGSKSRKSVMHWDSEARQDYVTPLLDIAPYVVIWGGNFYVLPPSRGWLSWFKPDAPPTMAQIELAWTNLNRPAKQISHSIAATNRERVGHPTQKPLRVMQWSIQQSGVRDGLILDPFMGSGTTLRAAKDAGFPAIGIEIEKSYCEMAANRLRQEVLQFS